MEVAGVDGCERGWLVVRAETGERLRVTDVRVEPTFAGVLEGTRECAAVGIDIPIGLSEDGRREPDAAARRVLSPLRHNSVFPAPVRPALIATSYRDACDISAAVRPDGKRLWKQSYYLGKKIFEVDRTMSAEPSEQQRIIEVHPEVCFWALNGHAPLAHYKKTHEGEYERLELLSSVYDETPSFDDLPAGAGRDDLIDACAAAWTAARRARGEAQTLPDEPPVDSHGLRMEIVY